MRGIPMRAMNCWLMRERRLSHMQVGIIADRRDSSLLVRMSEVGQLSVTWLRNLAGASAAGDTFPGCMRTKKYRAAIHRNAVVSHITNVTFSANGFPWLRFTEGTMPTVWFTAECISMVSSKLPLV